MIGVVSSTHPRQAFELDDRARRAERLAKMFARWEAEDVSDEPEWDVEQIAPLRFREAVVELEDPSDEP
jgi:hypothetical protein